MTVSKRLCKDLNVYAPPGIEMGFHAAWKKVQEESPDLFWTNENEGHWVATSGALIEEVLTDHARFSSRMIILPPSIGAEHSGLIPTTIDPPEHRWYRKQLNEGLSPRHVRAIEEDIRGLARGLIGSFATQGQVDFTQAYAQRLPIQIFLKLVGLPLEDSARLKYLSDQMTAPEPEMSFVEARDALAAYLSNVVKERMANPGDDLISRMVGEPYEGRNMTFEEALLLSIQILVAGLDTVVNFLSFVMLHLAQDQALQAQLAADHSRITRAVGEFFRLYGLVTIARTVRSDMEFGGQQLKAGEMIATPTVLSGIDARQNSCPMDFDIDRVRPRHLAFGAGSHRCPGQELARAEVAITLEEWLKQIPDFRLKEDFSPVFSGGIVGRIIELQLVWDR